MTLGSIVAVEAHPKIIYICNTQEDAPIGCGKPLYVWPLCDRDTLWTIFNDDINFMIADRDGDHLSRYRFSTPLEFNAICTIIDSAIEEIPRRRSGTAYIGLFLPRIIELQIHYLPPPSFNAWDLLTYAKYKVGVGKIYVTSPEFKHKCVIGLLQSKLNFNEVELYRFETSLSNTAVQQIVDNFIT